MQVLDAHNSTSFNDSLFDQCSLLFSASNLCSTFVQCFIPFSIQCSIQFFCSVLVLFIKCSVLILEMCSRYFDPVNINHLQSINITHQTAPSSVLVSKRVAFYNHQHRTGYKEPIFSIGLADGETILIIFNLFFKNSSHTPHANNYNVALYWKTKWHYQALTK